MHRALNGVVDDPSTNDSMRCTKDPLPKRKYEMCLVVCMAVVVVVGSNMNDMTKYQVRCCHAFVFAAEELAIAVVVVVAVVVVC